MITTIIVIIIHYYINDNIKVHGAKLFPFYMRERAKRASASECIDIHV